MEFEDGTNKLVALQNLLKLRQELQSVMKTFLREDSW